MKITIGSRTAIAAVLSMAVCLASTTGLALTPSIATKQATKAAQRAPASTRDIAPGTVLTLTLNQALSSETSRAGEKVCLSLAEPLMVGRTTALRAGTPVNGKITVAIPAGRLARSGRLGIEIGVLRINGRSYELAAVHRDTLQKGTRFANNGAMRRLFAPVGSTVRNVLAANGRDPLPPSAATAKAFDSRTTEKTVAAVVGTRDPLARVELDGDSHRGKLVKSGIRVLARAGSSYASTILGGPLALLQRGEPLEVTAGTSVYAVVIARGQ